MGENSSEHYLYIDDTTRRVTRRHPLVTSAGPVDSGKVVALGPDGKISRSMLPDMTAVFLEAPELAGPEEVLVGTPVTFTITGGDPKALSFSWDFSGSPTVLVGHLTGWVDKSITVQWDVPGAYTARVQAVGDGEVLHASPYSETHDITIIEPVAGNDSNTVLLVQSNTTGTSSRFSDVSLAGRGGAQHPVIVHGVVHSTEYSKFGGSSMKFNGSSRLELPPHQDFIFDGDFTIDMVVTMAASAAYIGLCSTYRDGVLNRGIKLYGAHALNYGKPIVGITDENGSTYLVKSYYPLPSGSAHHVEICRSAGTAMIFIDGVGAGSTYVGNAKIIGHGLVIGADGSSYGYPVNGFIDEFRVSKGVARHTTNFVPRMTRYGPPSLAPGNDDNTVLLIKSSDTNGSTVFADVSKAGNGGSGHTVTPVGPVQHSTEHLMFGDSSIKFTTGAQLRVPGTDFVADSSQDWCVELVYAPSSDPAAQHQVLFTDDTGQNVIGYNSPTNPGKLYVIMPSVGELVSDAVQLMSGNDEHIAVVYDHVSAVVRFFVNGLSAGVVSVAPTLAWPEIRVSSTTQPIGGYVDNIRVSKGHPRYCCDFPVRDTAFTPDF